MSREVFQQLQAGLSAAIIGQTALLERLLITVLADGHLLVEGAPGLAKTTVIKTLASLSSLDFQRIQFTPDMIPADITGSDIYLADSQTFKYMHGPIFHNLILADEINRAPPKVQSALLEAMQEHQVTVGGTTRTLPELFMVMATQNPFEQAGTYALPEAQMDRFLMRVELDYPSAVEEQAILSLELNRLNKPQKPQAILGADAIQQAREEVLAVYMDELVEKYLVKLVDVTRHPEQLGGDNGEQLSRFIARGASPRATLALARASRARAWLHGRDFVEPGDIGLLAYDVLGHRLHLSMDALSEQVDTRQVVQMILDAVPIP